MSDSIHFANPEDFDAVRNFDPHSNYIDLKRIQSKIDQNEIILLRQDDQIAGLLKFSYLWATRPFLDLIYIREGLRNNGLGTEMLGYLENYLRENGHSTLLSSTEADEEMAQRWHRKMGFAVCGTLQKVNLPEAETDEIFFFKLLEANKKLRQFQ